MELDQIKAIAAHEVSRRGLLTGLGAAAGAWGLAKSDPVYAATFGYDEKHGLLPASYRRPAVVVRRSPAKDTALAWIDRNAAQLIGLSDRIWDNAELSLREWESALVLARLLSNAGFQIEWGTAGLPAAFVATFQHGSGGPVLGFNGEYDALPGLSQRPGATEHDPLVYNYDPYDPTYGPGHGDAHNTLGVASAGAAIAVARALRANNLNATLKYFGSSGEEQVVGKAYAVRDGFYDGLDAYLDWHPFAFTTAAWGITFSALTSATFHFLGAAGHGGFPLGNRSGLDGALVMAHMTEYLRQNNVGPAARMHYAVVNGGAAPNIAPDLCSIWYYVREGSPARCQVLFDKVVRCAEAAASATQTTLSWRINSSIWNSIGNKTGAEIIHDNMVTIGPPTVSPEDVEYATALQRALGRPEVGVPQTIIPLTPPNPVYLGGGSSDSADVAWKTPLLFFVAATVPPGIPLHNWAATGCAISGIAHSGMLAAARYLAATAIDLVVQPELLAAVREEWQDRTAGTEWQSLLPADLQPPIYQPPQGFLRRTGQSWPPPGITWPVPPIIAREQLGTTGPDLPPVT